VTPEPTRRLAGNARTIWRLEQIMGWGVAIAIAFGVASRVDDGTLDLLLRVVPVLGLLVGVVVVPELRWRRWRWDVRPHEIDIRHGTFTVRRTLIPMARVQHVDTTRDILEQTFTLASVEVHTAAGSHEIPMLTLRDADEVRDRIAALARTDEP